MKMKSIMTAAKPGLVAEKRNTLSLLHSTNNVISFDPDDEEEETGDSAGGSAG